jgi:hypothetical protein
MPVIPSLPRRATRLARMFGADGLGAHNGGRTGFDLRSFECPSAGIRLGLKIRVGHLDDRVIIANLRNRATALSRFGGALLNGYGPTIRPQSASRRTSDE